MLQSPKGNRDSTQPVRSPFCTSVLPSLVVWSLKCRPMSSSISSESSVGVPSGLSSDDAIPDDEDGHGSPSVPESL